GGAGGAPRRRGRDHRGRSRSGEARPRRAGRRDDGARRAPRRRRRGGKAGGGRGADVVIEAAGSPASFRLSVEAVRPGGEVIWLGKTDVDSEVPFRWGALMAEKRIRRSSYGGARPARDFP